jgi:hypothetical protein
LCNSSSRTLPLLARSLCQDARIISICVAKAVEFTHIITRRYYFTIGTFREMRCG